MYFFPDLEPVCCSMSSSNCYFLTCIQISQEAGQVVWYSHIFKNFPEFVVVHTVKGFGIVNKTYIIQCHENSLSSHEKTWRIVKCNLLIMRWQSEKAAFCMTPTMWIVKKSVAAKVWGERGMNSVKSRGFVWQQTTLFNADVDIHHYVVKLLSRVQLFAICFAPLPMEFSRQ